MAVFAPPAAAQEVPPLTPGARVRVWAPELRDHKLAGTLVELGADTLVLQARPDAGWLRIPRAWVTRLDVSRGRKSRVGSGIKYGVLAGLVTGALVGGIVCKSQYSCSNAHQEEGDMTPLYALGGAVMGAGSGLIVGALVGDAASGERWEEVPQSRWRIGAARFGDGRFGFAASAAF